MDPTTTDGSITSSMAQVPANADRVDTAADRPATWWSVLAVAEFRALWAAYGLSLFGDSLARVALALLVYRQTGSPLWSGAIFAVTFLPWIVGGPLLSGLADRYPRRTVMVATSLGSAGFAAVLALPTLPVPVLFLLVFLLILLEAPFRAARAAQLVAVLPGDRYVLGSTLMSQTSQAALIAGYAAGGVLVAAIGSRPALLLDAVTFATAAVLIRSFSPDRPAADAARPSGNGRWSRRMTAGAAVVFGAPKLRRLVQLAWLASIWVVPEGLAVPYAAALGGDGRTVGLLLAVVPAGTVVGSLLLSRLVRPSRRLRLLIPLAVLAGVPMLLCGLNPSLPVALVLLAASGVGSSYQAVANAEFMQTVPDAHRAQAFGLVATGLWVGQGLGILAAGAAAEHVAPHLVVAAAGGLGMLLVSAIALSRTATGSRAQHTADDAVPDPH